MKSITNLKDLKQLNLNIEIEKEFYYQIMKFSKQINTDDFYYIANFILIEKIEELYQQTKSVNCIVDNIENLLDIIEVVEKYNTYVELIIIMNNDFFVSISIPNDIFNKLNDNIKQKLI